MSVVKSKKSPRAIVLLSAGLDSTLNAYIAKKRCDLIHLLTFDYGQKAASKELEHADWIARELEVPLTVIELPWLKEITQTSLVNSKAPVPVGSEIEIDDQNVSVESAAKVWVPNRNGVFLNIAAAFADSLPAELVVPGFNVEEAGTFPDNSEEFLNAITDSFSYSTSKGVRAHSFTASYNKTEMVKMAKELSVPLRLIWSCYHAFDRHCGQCESCQRFKRALQANGVLDEVKMD